MDLAIREHGEEAVVVLSGRIDANSAQDLSAELATLSPTIKTVIFDFEQVDYIASAGLRVLLATFKKLSGAWW